jgi:plastocyanin
MKALKAILVGLMVVVLAVAVPVASLAVDYEAAQGHGHAKSSTANASTSSAPQDVSVVIRHQKRHCHAWSYNGDAYAADQLAKLSVGDSITVTNNDVMSHKLVELTGPAATLTTPAMDKTGATSTITFAKPGTYMLGTKPGEDYTKGIVTTGADNVLRIRVVVT